MYNLIKGKNILVNTHIHNLTNDLRNGYRTEIRPILDHNLSTKEVQEDLNKFNEIKLSLLMNVALSNYKVIRFLS